MIPMRQTFTRITINGVTYNSVDEMPAEVRKQHEETLSALLADRDQNGVPDIVERHGSAEMIVEHVNTHVFDGSVSGGPIEPEQLRQIKAIVPSNPGIHISIP